MIQIYVRLGPGERGPCFSAGRRGRAEALLWTSDWRTAAGGHARRGKRTTRWHASTAAAVSASGFDANEKAGQKILELREMRLAAKDDPLLLG